MDLVKRFLKYVSYDTQSDEESESTPSSLKQLELGKYLVWELKSLGVKDALLDEYGIVYGTIPSNVDYPTKTIGLIAHMDTSPDASGANIKPTIIKSYDGSDILLNKEKGIYLKPSEFESLNKNIGEDLIVTDGTTLLGADDKAGIAIIVEVIQTLLTNKNIKHGDIKIAFTPDEEVGRGTEHFDVEYFNCDFAYTLDGGDIDFIEYECFNAASARVIINGISIHPGSAKNKMVNSQLVAYEFDQLLPNEELPSKTEKYEGFHHLCGIEGSVEKTTMDYIIRNHDLDILRRQENDFTNAMNIINTKYGYKACEVYIKESYRNMKEVIEKNMEVLDRATNAYKKLNYSYEFEAIRGGTDGANLSFMGLPCPNLGDGGYNFHGPMEYVSITQMKKMVKILLEIIKA